MVKVNLLTTGIGKVKRGLPLAAGIQRALLAVIILSLIFFLSGLYLRLVSIYQRKRFSAIVKQYQQAEELVKKVKLLNQEKELLLKELNSLNKYLKRDLLWSGKLEQLRSLIPEEIWLTQISSERKSSAGAETRVIFLRGGLIAQDKTSPIGTLSKFINQMKQDTQFLVDFENLILSDLRAENKQNLEIMAFTIELPLRKN